MEKLRIERRLTKVRLADFPGLRDSYIRAIAKGVRNPSINAIYAICEALDISVIKFMEKVESRRQELLRATKEKNNCLYSCFIACTVL